MPLIVRINEERFPVGSCELDFHCNVCGQTNCTDVVRFKTVDKWLGLLTVWVSHETAVKCPGCQTTFRCNSTPEELLRLPSVQASDLFRIRVGFIQKFLVIAGWAVTCTGPVSLVMFLFAFFSLPPAARGWRLAAMFGLIVSGLLTMIMLASFALVPR